MSKSIVIAERDNIAAVIEDNKVAEFFIHKGDVLLGDVYLASVQNILPSIDAAFVNVGSSRMGFLHANDVAGKGALKDKLTPNQKIMVQVVKEPTGHKGPRVTTALSLPGRFLVLIPDEKGINISRKIASPKERARLKSVVSLFKPAGVGVIIRTEAEGQSEAEIQEDLEFLLEKWNNIITAVDTVEAPNLISRDQDLLYRVIREACSDEIDEIIVDTPFALQRTNQLFQSWNLDKNIKVSAHKGNEPLLIAKGIDKEIKTALNTKVNLPSGGYLFIQTTEALTVIDVNSGKFTSSASQNETIRKTNLESVHEIARQLRLRNIGGMIIIDFIDMDNRVDKLTILEALELALEPDKSKPQVGQLSDLGLVELTRHRQGQSLAEIFTKKCPACNGAGAIIEDLNFLASTQEGEQKAKAAKFKLPQMPKKSNQNQNQNQNPRHQQRQNKKQQPQQTQQQKQEERKIETSPSIVAADTTKQVKSVDESFELSREKISDFIAEKGHIATVSNIVKITGLEPAVINNHMSKDSNKEVFTLIQELKAIAKDKKVEATTENKVAPVVTKETETEENKPETQLKSQPTRTRRAVKKVVRQETKADTVTPSTENTELNAVKNDETVTAKPKTTRRTRKTATKPKVETEQKTNVNNEDEAKPVKKVTRARKTTTKKKDEE